MRDIIIAGGGVAGIQAGVFTSKADQDTLIIDSGESLVLNTSNIKNLIGHDSISGSELLKKGKNKFKDFGGSIKDDEVVEVVEKEDHISVECKNNDYKAKYLIVATAGDLSYLEDTVRFEEGEDGPYLMERHVKTDHKNKAKGTDRIYAAGLANTWEYQTAVAMGDGGKAAVNLMSKIKGEPFEDHDT